MPRPPLPTVALCSALLLCAARQGPARAQAPPVEFNRDVRPILSEACFQCHGPDRARRKAGLRLDTREGAFAELENGPVIVPGKPDGSPLVDRITSADDGERMPPKGSGRSLSKAQV